jgi:hypothetical protein
VALPDVDLAGTRQLGPDAPREIVLDGQALETSQAARTWVDACLDYWGADGSSGSAPGVRGLELIDGLLAPTLSLRRLVRGQIEDDRPILLDATRAQLAILNHARSVRRAEVVGPAGSGKSMIAVEKARRFAAEGYRTLLVCFNQRLASELDRELRGTPASGGLLVTTFHRLGERLASQAGVLPARPSPIPQDWWDSMLPKALEAAMDALPDERFHAIVVDEGQDFDRGWLDTLDLLLETPGVDQLWVFHDPGQALYRDDRVGELGLVRLDLFENLRNPGPVSALADRFYRGGEGPAGFARTAFRRGSCPPSRVARRSRRCAKSSTGC